jgi:uncharacterized protein (TIGR02147 family)
MNLFEFDDYRTYLVARIKKMPHLGKGQSLKIANHLGIHPSLLSQITKGSRDFSLEQACDLTHYLGLTELETEYFMALVQYQRAGTPRLKKMNLKKIEKLRSKSLELVHRLPPDAVLDEAKQAFFYSHWLHSGIRLLTSIEGTQTIDTISDYFRIPKKKATDILKFLVDTNLCVKNNDQFHMGIKHTHLPADSTLVSRHHMNWRIKALERHSNIQTHELAFTSPVSLSKSDGPKVREILVEAVEKAMTVIDRSKSEKLACLNIDWFDF